LLLKIEVERNIGLGVKLEVIRGVFYDFVANEGEGGDDSTL
jgi:hypothetical protein